MKATAKNQHYLAQAYLAAFTKTGKKKGQFHVFEPDTWNCFRTSPRNVAAQRYFNWVDIEGKPHDTLENALSPLENRMAQACRNVNRTETFPSGEDFSYIINLIALVAIRNPKVRTSLNRSREQVINLTNRLLVSNKGIFEHYMKKGVEEGCVRENNITFEKMKQVVENYECKIEFPPGGDSPLEFDTIDDLIPLLGQRAWSLFIAPNPGPCFICSDHPVALTWKDSERNRPIGYGLRKTEVFFPLGLRTGFYGVYEDHLPTVVRLKSYDVAKWNGRVLENAEKYVYSTFDKFLIEYKGELREVDCYRNDRSHQQKKNAP